MRRQRVHHERAVEGERRWVSSGTHLGEVRRDRGDGEERAESEMMESRGRRRGGFSSFVVGVVLVVVRDGNLVRVARGFGAGDGFESEGAQKGGELDVEVAEAGDGARADEGGDVGFDELLRAPDFVQERDVPERVRGAELAEVRHPARRAHARGDRLVTREVALARERGRLRGARTRELVLRYRRRGRWRERRGMR